MALLIRSVITLDNLISNKLAISEVEKEGEKRKEDQKQAKKADRDDVKGGEKEKEGDGKGNDKDKGDGSEKSHHRPRKFLERGTSKK